MSLHTDERTHLMLLETRHATMEDLAALLQQQEAHKLDMVVPAGKVHSRDGHLFLSSDDEVRELVPTAIADKQLAERLGIPTAYLRKLRADRPDIYDANLNGWLRGDPDRPGSSTLDELLSRDDGPMTYGPDSRAFMFRTFTGDDETQPGILRAVLSDRYGRIDNLDVLVAALKGVKESGTSIEVVGCDLTESRMTLRIAAPEIMVNAPKLLDGYRSPWGDRGIYDHSGGQSQYFTKGQLPQHWQDKYGLNADGVFAGLVITNGETGGTAFTITPRLMILACTNGAMIVKDALRAVHLGSKLDEGNVEWSAETHRLALELITSKAQDAVAAFLDETYVEMAIDDIERKSGKRLNEPAKTIEIVARELAFTEAQRDCILDHFIKGGQTTAGGVFQAVTSFVQELDDADIAFELEALAMRALDIAAR